MYHSAGASDPLTKAEIKKPINDGLPETLEDWIPYRGVTAIKIKLNGNDLRRGSQPRAVDSPRDDASAGKRGFHDWIYSLDFNERFARMCNICWISIVSSVSRPPTLSVVSTTSRAADQRAIWRRTGQNTMLKAAKLRPVVIDESLTGLDALLLAREMGYTGVALQGMQGPGGDAAACCGGGKVQDVPLRAGSDVPWRRAGAFSRYRRAYPRRFRALEATCGSMCPRQARAGRNAIPVFSTSVTAIWTPPG